jgi:hypothetical protein
VLVQQDDGRGVTAGEGKGPPGGLAERLWVGKAGERVVESLMLAFSDLDPLGADHPLPAGFL